jgi:hypothetical protein
MEIGDIIKSKITGTLGIVLKGFGSYGEYCRFLPINCEHYILSDLQIVTEENFSDTSVEEKVRYIIDTFCHDGKVTNSFIIDNGRWIILEAVLGSEGKSITRYFPYLNFRSTDRGYLTKESALIGIQEYDAQIVNKEVARRHLEKLESRRDELHQKIKEIAS